MLRVCGGHEDPADALARQGQALGVGVAHDRAVVDARHPRHLGAVGDLTVGLVGDEVDLGAKARAGLAERAGERLEVGARVDGPHGVVGRVDDDGLGARRDGGSHGLDVDLEGLGVGEDLHARGARRLDPDAVLREVRGDHDDLVPVVHDRVERDGEGGRGAAGQVEVASSSRALAEAAGEARGHGLAHGGQAARGRVAVQLRRGQRERALDRGAHGVRRGDGGVAKREVKDVLGADLGLPGARVRRDLADGGLLRPVRAALLVDAHFCSSRQRFSWLLYSQPQAGAAGAKSGRFCTTYPAALLARRFGSPQRRL